ncbi:hypothetical protein C343_04820 [Cryptococcus neoformans C23]|uniref:F-box domain-containing protein n=1 Tax=Cryptococcus neoformans (strain H99 / ATCC 208821 / CBS 10515 / FGSC 9487) TaxID=235443 RepID=J9VQD4_CRYN9|nr:hypothetical protein CNAG_03467 [Cryptococcus neoformans var. grubii H99]AFR96692.1 hypothetical protein CNAG_03467 [Cryptococcus neoformans var. grubii H99]AUB26641.1 hypothetical protein CKF44_03467 [Cryptococcus neoformans var. grubii]OWZ41658.1 hypothetical protein C343_04820 [Cryptococcus neoformans var. grubii C23]|eukprot:XP_012051279.1 hypothetical protein CNAG_03467 [Cryptococcus neoformans var. grubii H99]
MTLATTPSTASPIMTHPDILPVILSFADRQTLSRCMQATWKLFNLASPYLYSNIRLIPNEADAFLHGASFGPIILEDGSERDLKRELLAMVKVLNIERHQGCNGFLATACSRWRGLGIEFPSLNVLRVWVGPNMFEGGWFNCPWIPNMSPQKLVMRNVTAISAGSSYTFAPQGLLCKVQKVVVVVPKLRNLSDINRDALNSRRRISESPIQPGTETVIVFWTEGPDSGWWPEAPLADYDNIVDQIVLCSLAEADKLTICNAGSMYPVVSGNGACLTYSSYQEREEEVAAAVKRKVEQISRRRGELARLGKRLESLRFMSFGEYLEKEEWKGEFDSEEVAPWVLS